jgi:LuxR family maltose regulon positive regulatory protein
MVVDELAIGQLIEPRGSHLLADEFRRMPLDQARTQAEPFLVAAAMELYGAAGDPSVTSLDAAETILDGLPADQELAARLAAALVRLAVSRQAGDLEAATAAADHAEALIDEMPEELLARHPVARAQVWAGRGAVKLWAGQLDEAAAIFEAGVAAARVADSSYEHADCLGYLALAEALSGRLNRAAELAGEAAGAADSSDDGIAEPNGAASVALAYVHLERGEMQLCRDQLALADAALRVRPDKVLTAVASLVGAHGRQAEGRPGAASELVGRARQGWSPPGWLEQRLMILESRAYAAAGDIQAAVEAAGRADGQATPDAAIALAHAYLAAGDYPAAQAATTAVMAASGEPGEQVSLEAWLVDARLSYSTGHQARGRRSLEHALRLGKHEQIRLPFVMEQTWIRPVLRRDPDLAQAYRHLLGPDIVRPAGVVAARESIVVPVRQAITGEGMPLVVERLSERELEVVQHLSGMLSTAEIASEMYISVNTVKTHLRSIYRKLSAAHRGEAVRRARQLELI